MIFPNFCRFMFLLSMTSVSLVLYSQDKKETIILYNTQPVKAVIDVESKNIDYIIQNEDDYLIGFKLEIPDYEKFLRETNPVFSSVPLDKDTTSFSYTQLQNSPQSRATSSNNEIEPTVFSYVKFQKGFATLSDDAIRLLELVIAEYDRSQNNIVLRSFSISSDNILAKNRSNAVKTYLKIRGLDTNKVTVEHLKGELDIDEIMVVFKE